MTTNISQEFPDPTTEGTYLLPTVGLDEGSFVFTHLGSFLSFVTPHDLPIDVLKNAFFSKVSLLQLTLEALKVESGFILLVVVFFVIGLIPLCITLGWLCSNSTCGDDDGDLNATPVDTLMTLEESWQDDINCTIRSLSFFLQFMIIFLIAGVISMFITNEQISSTIDKTPTVVTSSLQDFNLFLHETNEKIVYTLNEGINTATERVKIDLEDIDKLLGEPIQTEIAIKTKIEDVFISILNICTVNTEIVQRILLLRQTLAAAIKISQDATAKMEELQIQLSVLQRQCTTRDRPLCDTLRLKSFEEMGITNAFHKLKTDSMLLKMLTLGETEINHSWKNLSSELHYARTKFRSYPIQIQEDTVKHRSAIIRQLSIMKDMAKISSRTLTTTIQFLLSESGRFWEMLQPFFRKLHDVGILMWAVSLSTCLMILAVSLVLLGALSCGCCYAESKAGIALVLSAILMSLASIVLATFTIFGMIIGGHGEVFLCRPLYDYPKYSILERLFNRPGLVYELEPTYGILDNLLRPPGPETEVFNISIGTVINECEYNRSTYDTFELAKLVNVTALTDYREYPELEYSFDNLTATEFYLQDVTKNLQIILQRMIYDSNINLAQYRIEISHPTPEKEIATFTDQMQRVSLQIQDIATASRMTTLGSKARHLQASVMQPLEQLRVDVLYHLTALELQRDPWIKKINNTILDLRATQRYIDQDAHIFCTNSSKVYSNRLKGHLDRNNQQTYEMLATNTATCGPIFDIFNAYRVLICHHMINPLNGLWFISLLCLLLWLLATPFSLILASTYRRAKRLRKSRNTNSHQAPNENRIISEQSHWGSIGDTTQLPDIDRVIQIIHDEKSKNVDGNYDSDIMNGIMDVTYIYFNEDLNSEVLI